MMSFPKPVQTILDLGLSKATPDAAYRPLYNADHIIGDTIFSTRVFTGGVVVVVGKLASDYKPIQGSQMMYHYNVMKCGRVDYYVSSHHKSKEPVC
tara:strand:+ start:22 stop:309 length:288 start_codon:yes stop_codon:yes gene_type:complete